jgi:hypothetical protein
MLLRREERLEQARRPAHQRAGHLFTAQLDRPGCRGGPRGDR